MFTRKSIRMVTHRIVILGGNGWSFALLKEFSAISSKTLLPVDEISVFDATLPFAITRN